ncbi:MAG: nodulation protein NfeD [Bacteriovoracaceae bacterium]|jgi:membrane-bound serine protease (ClpP class)|nr:nodulation protein NfeD [Bacteriovoracaceae bacterium]
MKRLIALVTFITAISFYQTSLFADDAGLKTHNISSILTLKIDSSINPATLNYIKEGFKKADAENYHLIVIKMNTPGGLVHTTKDILTEIGNSSVPVVIWITPEGASATSAGALISSGAHLLFMSDGTNIGAATPIQMSGDIPGKAPKEVKGKKGGKKELTIPAKKTSGDLRAKAINDLVALTESLSEARGRNAQAFGEMVKTAKSYKAKEALEKNIVNGICNNFTELLEKIKNQKISVKGKNLNLVITGAYQVTELEMDMGQKLLDILANPNLAYLLFLAGIALLYFELQAPGGFVAGGIGAVLIIFAGIGFQVLPLNFGALGLMVLSFVLFILEAYITSYGLLSLAGVAALVSGSLFLFRSSEGQAEISISLIISAVSAILLFLVSVGYLLVRDFKKNKNKKDTYSLIGDEAEVMDKEDHGGHTILQVKVKGSIWKAQGPDGLSAGDTVKIVGEDMQKLMLTVEQA